MSPLARSLLALGALLAAADAKITTLPVSGNARCGGFTVDITSKPFQGAVYEVKYNFTKGIKEEIHNIPNACPRGMSISSQTVQVCNDYVPAVMYVHYLPTVAPLGDETLSPVYAACDAKVIADDNCEELHFHITQKCRRLLVLY